MYLRPHEAMTELERVEAVAAILARAILDMPAASESGEKPPESSRTSLDESPRFGPPRPTG